MSQDDGNKPGAPKMPPAPGIGPIGPPPGVVPPAPKTSGQSSGLTSGQSSTPATGGGGLQLPGAPPKRAPLPPPGSRPPAASTPPAAASPAAQTEAPAAAEPESTPSDEPAAEPAPPGPAILPRAGARARSVAPPAPRRRDVGLSTLPPDHSSQAAVPEQMKALDTMALLDDLASELGATTGAQSPSELSMTRKRAEPVIGEERTQVFERVPIPPRKDPPWKMIAGIGGGVALLGLVALFTCGDDETPAVAAAQGDTESPGGEAETPVAAAPADLPPPDDEPEPEPEPDLPSEDELETPPDLPPDPELEPEPEPEPEPTKKTTKKKKKKKTTKSSAPAPSTAAPKPAVEPKPTTTPSAAKGATDLLADATKALRSGKASSAYSLASKSYAKGGGSKAAEVMTEAACKMGSQAKAEAALKKVGVFKRAGLKRTCKGLGVKL